MTNQIKSTDNRAQPSREKLSAMTTNERLFETGQMDAFDSAVEKKDVRKMREILTSIFVDEPSIELIINRSL